MNIHHQRQKALKRQVVQEYVVNVVLILSPLSRRQETNGCSAKIRIPLVDGHQRAQVPQRNRRAETLSKTQISSATPGDSSCRGAQSQASSTWQLKLHPWKRRDFGNAHYPVQT